MKFGKMLKHFLIPHKENDFKPHSLRTDAVTIAILLIFLIEWAMIGQSFLLSRNSDFLAEVLPAVLVDLTNNDRSQNSAGSLSVSQKLTEAAQLKANDMAAKGYFSHTTPEGFEPWHWLDAVGYTYASAGENLAVNFFDSMDVEKAWMNSPSHRRNVVNPEYSEIGIAMAQGTYKGQNTIYVVQFFGKPKAAEAAVAIEAPTATPIPSTTVKIAKAAAATPIAETPTAVEATPDIQLAQVKAAETIAPRPPSPSLMQKIISSPRTMDRYLLGGLLAMVVAALGFAVLVEIRIQHKHIIANGLGLVVVIGLGFIINTHIFSSSVTVIGPDESTSSFSSF